MDGKEKLTLDRTSSVPLYHQLLEVFNHFLADRAWKIGDRIPTEAELARIYGVSKITVKQALSILVQEGKIERLSGKGTFVTHPRYDHTLPISPGFSEYFPIGNKIKIEVLEWKKVLPSSNVQHHLGSRPHEKVFLLRRLIFSDEVPIAFQSVFYPTLVDHEDGCLSEEDTFKISLLQKFGDVTHLEETFEPVALDGYESKLIDLRVGTPAIMIERTVFNRDLPLAFEKFLMARCKIKLDRFILTASYLTVPE